MAFFNYMGLDDRSLDPSGHNLYDALAKIKPGAPAANYMSGLLNEVAKAQNSIGNGSHAAGKPARSAQKQEDEQLNDEQPWEQPASQHTSNHYGGRDIGQPAPRRMDSDWQIGQSNEIPRRHNGYAAPPDEPAARTPSHADYMASFQQQQDIRRQPSPTKQRAAPTPSHADYMASFEQQQDIRRQPSPTKQREPSLDQPDRPDRPFSLPELVSPSRTRESGFRNLSPESSFHNTRSEMASRDDADDFWSTAKSNTNKIHNMSTDNAMDLIRTKIAEKFDGRVGWIRRAFVNFDGDGSGAIDLQEFKSALKMKTGLDFENRLLQKIWKQFDDDGSGEINFRKFTEMVMDSGRRDATALQLPNYGNKVSNDSGNSEMMLKRKVRMGFRDLRRAFKDLDRSGNGVLKMKDFQFALQRMDIVLNDTQFIELARKIDKNGDGQISYAEFLDYFRQEDEQMGLKQVGGISVDAALEMVRTKIGEKMDGREGAMRRAFQFFDADGSGAIDKSEFKKAMMVKTGLVFEDELLDQIFVTIDDDGTGEIDYRKFVTLVMGSGLRDANTINTAALRGRAEHVSDDAGNSQMMLYRKVRMAAKDLRNIFKDLDPMGCACHLLKCLGRWQWRDRSAAGLTR